MPYQQKETNTIFIVEDDNANGALLTEIILQETNCHALLLINAWQVLKVAQYQRPLLFVLDYYLPDMNGIELHDQLQLIEGLQGVPTLIIGASLETHEQLLYTICSYTYALTQLNTCSIDCSHPERWRETAR